MTWRLVALAGLVCFLSSLVAVHIFHRAASAQSHAPDLDRDHGRRDRLRHLGRISIAMLAYDPGITIGYGVALTGLSLAAAMVLTSTGFGICSQQPPPGRCGDRRCHRRRRHRQHALSRHVGAGSARPRLVVDRSGPGVGHRRHVVRHGGADDRGALGGPAVDIPGGRAAHACDHVASFHRHGRRRACFQTPQGCRSQPVAVSQPARRGHRRRGADGARHELHRRAGGPPPRGPHRQVSEDHPGAVGGPPADRGLAAGAGGAEIPAGHGRQQHVARPAAVRRLGAPRHFATSATSRCTGCRRRS